MPTNVREAIVLVEGCEAIARRIGKAHEYEVTLPVSSKVASELELALKDARSVEVQTIAGDPWACIVTSAEPMLTFRFHPIIE